MLNNDTYKVPQEAPLIVLDSNSAICMAKNGKDTKQTRYIASRTNFVRNGERFKMHKIDWCEEVMQLSYIDTNNVGEHYLTPRMKYIMVIVDN